MVSPARRAFQAAAPLAALLGAVGALLVAEIGIQLASGAASPRSIAGEASLAIRHMFGLAFLVGVLLSVVAWFGARTLRSYPPILVAIVCGFAGLAVVASALAFSWPLRGSQSDRPDVLLIVVDTLRADHVTPARTPNLARLAGQGASFTRAYSNAPWTLPSFGTMLTGHFPRTHGAGVDGDYGTALGPLRKDVMTLAEEFQKAGYQTVGLTTNPHLRPQNGLNRGFEHYRNLMRDNMMFSATFPIAATTRFAPGSVQTERALAWFGLRDPQRPLFMLLHYMDPHLPRTPGAALLAAERKGQPEGSAEALAYGAMVRSADQSIGRLLDALGASGLLEHTIVAYTADHGEGLEFGTDRWDHGGAPLPALVRVPLVFRLPGAKRVGAQCRGLATHIDLGATLLGLAGLDPVLGVGHAMLASDGSCGRGRGAVFQSMSSKGPARDGMTTAERGLIWSRPDAWAVYDPIADPEYRQPLDPAPRALAADLRRHVDTQKRRAAQGEIRQPHRLSPETVDQLEALGYLNPGDDSNGPN